jgi:hypothetical protein
MVIDTHRFRHPRFDRPRAFATEYLKSDFHKHLAIARKILIRDEADFIFADTAKGSFIVVEMKRNVRRAGTREIASYSQMPILARGRYTPLPEPVKVARPIEISYLNQELVETLLDNKGKRTLEKVLSLIKSSATELDWPLARIEIRYVRDPEVEKWEYILLLLVFTCDFETADRHLNELYNEIDVLTGELSDEEQEALRRMIFFDIEAKAGIPSD